MADKLKPCPFCGGEGTLVEDIYNDHLYNYAICSNDYCNANTGRCDTEDEAITKWNNRPSPWHTGTPTENGWYLLECNIGNSDGTYYATDHWDNEVGYWTVNRVIRWQKIKED